MTAIAESSLSKNSSEIAIGGGAFGWSAAITGGHEYESEERKQKRRDEETSHMIITYNFPRVTLSLDNHHLELTEECKADLVNVRTREDAGNFKRKFGKVQLGGRLHSTQESVAVTGDTTAEKSKRLKATAAMSFSGPFLEGSVKGGYGSDATRQDKTSDSKYDSHMAWEAKGGDTLLCNNPSAWCQTVSSYYNWRVVKQEGLMSMEDIIGQVAQDQKAIFENLKKYEERSRDSSVEILLYHQKSGRYLGFNTEADPLPPIIFADRKKRLKLPPITAGFLDNWSDDPGIKPLLMLNKTLDRGPRKTLSLGEVSILLGTSISGAAKPFHAQILKLSGNMVQDDKKCVRFKLMKHGVFTAWNADINCSVGCVPVSDSYKRTQLQECFEPENEKPVRFHFTPVESQSAAGLGQKVKVTIEVYSDTEFLGQIREAVGQNGAVVVDRGSLGKFHDKGDIDSSEPLEFTLQYLPSSENAE
ncbi:membrane attack complex component perforin [Fusarium longipes]|uniref:Membrane attack complex component perforin n=1 Tax=Fusarium longipes TaxID=694270 RepID=A0A395SAG8_9HYPO|nr:membrane attack complex component perforin [Fusarium longipes]